VRDPATIYVETLGKMADLSGDAGLMERKSRNWNRLADRLQEARKILAATPEGRSTITSMMSDSRVTVRLWAAGHALHWPESSADARTVLRAISDERTYGLNRLTAQVTLSEFDAGHLNPNW
jgi:hypothetical protein